MKLEDSEGQDRDWTQKLLFPSRLCVQIQIASRGPCLDSAHFHPYLCSCQLSCVRNLCMLFLLGHTSRLSTPRGPHAVRCVCLIDLPPLSFQFYRSQVFRGWKMLIVLYPVEQGMCVFTAYHVSSSTLQASTSLPFVIQIVDHGNIARGLGYAYSLSSSSTSDATRRSPSAFSPAAFNPLMVGASSPKTRALDEFVRFCTHSSWHPSPTVRLRVRAASPPLILFAQLSMIAPVRPSLADISNGFTRATDSVL
ncbi:hypothetical protein OF83DRAFT_1100727 [Amylostereum chailletii]|nr:hypothetical protein OF83DRAFT_1100727 [Amylostereum chailletii]